MAQVRCTYDNFLVHWFLLKRFGRAWIAVGLITFAVSSSAQNVPFLFHLTFRGTNYQTNTAGEIITTPITEMTLLQEVAAPVGITDLSTLAVVYHVRGNGLGDTIEVVNPTNGVTLDTLLGFYFGADTTLGRIALTNSAGTQERRVDQVYNTKQSQFALGSAFITKRFLKDQQGNERNTIDADVHYLVLPRGTEPAKCRVGTFTTTRPFKPRQ